MYVPGPSQEPDHEVPSVQGPEEQDTEVVWESGGASWRRLPLYSGHDITLLLPRSEEQEMWATLN